MRRPTTTTIPRNDDRLAKLMQMSEDLVLLQWLNSNFELRERVVDSEKDLCDGFIFAQILHQSGLEPDLSKYEPSPGCLDHNRRVHNIKLLWNRLRIIGHEIPMNLLQCVMKGNRSVIYRVLRTLKVICKRHIKSTMFIDGGSESFGKTGAERVRNQKQRGSIDMPLRSTNRYANDKHTDIGHQPETNAHHLKPEIFSEPDEDRIDLKRGKLIERKNKNDSAANRNGRVPVNNEMKRKKMLDQLRDFEEKLQLPTTVHCGQSGGVAADDHKVLKHPKSNMTNKLRLMRELRDQHQPRRIQQDKRRNSRHVRLAREYLKSPQKSLVDNKLIPSKNAKILVFETDHTTKKASILTFQDRSSMSARELYIMSQRDQLDTHYLNLRVTSLHRQAKMLQAYKEFVASKKCLERPAIQNLCSHFVEKIIGLTFAIVSESESETRPLTEEKYVKLRKAHIVLDRENSKSDKFINESFKQIKEDVVDAEQLLKSWDHLDDQWIATRQLPERPASPAVEALLSNILSRWIDVMDEKTLHLAEQIWPSLSGFKIVVMYTYELGTISRPFAKQVAAQRNMHYLELDSVLDLCADSNSMLPRAECNEYSDILKRWLLPYQTNVTSYRQKTLAVPETLAGEVMIAAIRACRENEDDLPGCVVENFPRSIGQLRQLEKAYLADSIPDPSTQASFSASADAFFDTLQKERSSTPPPTDSYMLKSIDAVVELIGDCLKSKSKNAIQDALSHDISHGGALNNEGIEKDAHVHNANPILLSTKLFGSHNRFLQIDNSGLHDAVVLEAIHIAIECFTNGNFQHTAILEFLSHTYYPPMFMPAQRKHRDKASMSDQFYWLNAEKQLKIDKRDITHFCAEIKEINRKSNAKMVMLLTSVFTVIRIVVGQCHKLEQELRRILDVRQSLQQKFDKAHTMAGILAKDIKKQNILEVELGDIIDDSRMKANLWAEKHASPLNINEYNLGDLKQEVISLAHPLCEALIDGTLNRINCIEDNIYAKLPFLRYEVNSIVAPLLLENIPVLSSVQEIITLSNGKQESNMLQLLYRMNEAIATLFCQNESADRTSEKIRQTADFNREKESNRSKMILEDNDTWTSAPYAQRTGPHSSDYTQKCNDDSDMLIVRTSVYQNESNGLLYQIHAACNMITSLYHIVDELYVGECLGLNEVITSITKQHFHDISGMMVKLKQEYEVPTDSTIPSRCFIWPIARPEETRSFSLLASHLPSFCQSNFLSLLQVKVLIQEFQLLRVDNVETSNFIKIVHDCSKKNNFPDKWQDSLSLVSLSQCYVSRDNLIYWKSVILSILRIQFTDFTAIQEAQQCCGNLISWFCSQSNQPTLMQFMRSTLSFNDFIELLKSFGTSTSIHKDFAMGDKVASVTFDLISTRRPSISQEPLCTIQSVLWLISATISSPPLRHCQLFAHENKYHVQKLNRLLPIYSMGAIRGAAIVNQLIDAESFILDGDSTQFSPCDEQITRESAADALCVLLEVTHLTLHDSNLETINECATKLRRFHQQNPDMSYTLLAGEDIVQTSRIAIRLSLHNPFSSLASNSRG